MTPSTQAGSEAPQQDLQFQLFLLDSGLTLVGNHEDLDALHSAVDERVRQQLAQDDVLPLRSTVEPGGKLPPLELSCLQLADLSATLDLYYTDRALAKAKPRRPGLAHLWRRTPTWSKAAALVLLTAGLTTLALRSSPDLITASGPQPQTEPLSGGTPLPALPPVAVAPVPGEVPSGAPSGAPTAGSTAAPTPGQSQPLPSPPGPRTAARRPLVVVPANPPLGNLPPPPPPPPPGGFVGAPLPRIATAPRARRERVPQAPAEAPEPAETQAAARALERDQPSPVDPTANSPAPSAPPVVALSDAGRSREVAAYFQGRWSPPESLKQNLEYRLVLGPDGSLQRITPLSRTAGTYLDRTGMPLIGEQFVSPGAQGALILRLRPDGGVQAGS
ncbi:hypothetical protein H6F94_14650 [Leptolyngbya sp. FACHB-261]|nr:hypothetical protein [Leptolyngbya sp. FACHB-261]